LTNLQYLFCFFIFHPPAAQFRQVRIVQRYQAADDGSEGGIYAAADEQAALSALDGFEAVWGKKYPRIAASWRENWANLSTYFKFPQEVRRLIYTPNAIEGFNRQPRKVTKSKSVFPTDDSLLKML